MQYQNNVRRVLRIICVYREKWYNGDLDILEDYSLEVLILGYIIVNKEIILELNIYYYILRSSVKCEKFQIFRKMYRLYLFFYFFSFCI